MRLASILALTTLGLVGCGGERNPGPDLYNSDSADIASPLAATKKPLCGLVTMGSEAFVTKHQQPTNLFEEAYAHPAIYKGVVILATWSELEPTEGVFDFSSIDQAIANIEAYNAKYPSTPVVGKLRVFGGRLAPAWAQALDGGPLTVETSSGAVTVGHFWSQPYQSAWRTLQAQLASKYDGNALMGEVAVSSCSSLTAEPFVYPSGPKAASTLLGAGFTDAQMQACLSGALDDYAAWTITPIDYTFNRYELLDSGTGVADDEFETSLAQTFRERFAPRAVLANHGLQSPLASAAQAVYAELASIGPPIEFQTVGQKVDQVAAFQLGVGTYHATELEVWDTIAAGGSANLDTAQLDATAAQIACP